MDTAESDEQGLGLITKGQNMLMPRASHGITLIKVWKCLIYVMGGRADGHCERYDVNLNEWK